MIWAREVQSLGHPEPAALSEAPGLKKGQGLAERAKTMGAQTQIFLQHLNVLPSALILSSWSFLLLPEEPLLPARDCAPWGWPAGPGRPTC